MLEAIAETAVRLRDRLNSLDVAGIETYLLYESETLFRRSPDGRQTLKPSAPNRPVGCFRICQGLQIPPVFAETLEDFSRCIELYDPSGGRVVNTAGEDCCIDPGRSTTFTLSMTGKQAGPAEKVFDLIDEWALRNYKAILQIVPLVKEQTSAEIGSGLGFWFEVVDALGRRHPHSLIRIRNRKVQLSSRTTATVEGLDAFCELASGKGFLQPDEIETLSRVGKIPEDWFWDSDSVIEDSIEALALIRELIEQAPQQQNGSRLLSCDEISLGDETNIEAETTEAENKNPKGAGRKPKVTDRSEKKIMDAWASGRYKTHGDIDYEFELEKGEAKKVIERVNRRLKRSGQRTE